MPAPPPRFFLRSDEQVLLETGAASGWAWVLFLRWSAPIVVAGAAVNAVARLAPRIPDAVGWIALGVAVLALVVAALVARARQRSAEYVVTDQRVYARVGRLMTRLHLATHDRITDLRYRQGPLERALGVEGLSVMTAGGDVALEGLGDARAMRAAVENARDALVQRLLREAGLEHAAAAPRAAEAAPMADALAAGAAAPEAEAAAAALADPVPDEVPAPAYVTAGDAARWVEKPRLVAALASLRSLAGLLGIAAFVYVTRGAAAALSMLALLAGIAVMLLAVRLAQLRRAEYVATDHRIYARTGLVGTTIAQLTYDKITDITYRQDLIGRVLGYGSLTLSTAGGSPPIALQGLRDPLAAKETIERLRARHLREDRA